MWLWSILCITTDWYILKSTEVTLNLFTFSNKGHFYVCTWLLTKRRKQRLGHDILQCTLHLQISTFWEWWLIFYWQKTIVKAFWKEQWSSIQQVRIPCKGKCLKVRNTTQRECFLWLECLQVAEICFAQEEGATARLFCLSIYLFIHSFFLPSSEHT